MGNLIKGIIKIILGIGIFSMMIFDLMSGNTHNLIASGFTLISYLLVLIYLKMEK